MEKYICGAENARVCQMDYETGLGLYSEVHQNTFLTVSAVMS